jgi:hypothetical protein
MVKSTISVNINYEKNINGIYDLEIINNQMNNEVNIQNDIISDLNKQLQLSYELYNICIDKIDYTNDEKYKNIVDKLNKIKTDEIETLTRLHNENIKLNTEKLTQQSIIDIEYVTTNLNNTISIEQTKRACLENNLNEKILIESDKIKNEYQIEINNLKHQLETYEKQLNEEKESKNKMFEFYNSITHKIDNIDKYFNKNTPASISGEIGETFIFDYLSSSLELTNATLKKVSGKSNACDILLQYNNINCCIESKNHAAPIQQAQIKRFLNTDLNNPNYNCGIFISIKTEFADISNIKHFDIKYENNKPSIFLSKFILRPSDIILAIKILDFIIYNKNFNSSDINKYISMLTNNIDMLNSIIEINSDNIKNLNKSNLLIKNKQAEIEELLNIPKINEFICEKCNKIFKKQTTLAKHIINCK